MGGRHPDKFVLKRKDKAFLLEVLRDGKTPLKVARRVHQGDAGRRQDTGRPGHCHPATCLARRCVGQGD